MICVILAGFSPIIINSRPKVLDAYFFATTTCAIEAFLFLPIMLAERKNIKAKFDKNLISTIELNSLLYGFKNNKILLIYVGITFGVAQILFYWAYQLAGTINGSLAQKTAVIFGLLFGYLINREKISYKQIIFSLILFFGLILAVTQGSFNLLEPNFGVLLMLITVILWMLAHSITKPIFDREESTPIQMVFMRNSISALFLVSTYFIFYPLENVKLLFDSINLFFVILMGVTYGLSLFCWYKLLSYLGTSKATAMTSGTTIITIIFATILLSEVFTVFHVIGTILVIISVIMIVKPRKEND